MSGGFRSLLGMITYVHCHSSKPVVSCWHRACYEDPSGEKQTLCSFQPAKKMGNSLQPQAFPNPRPEGCLRKRLLSVSKVHQRPDSLWTPKPLLGPVAKSSPGKTRTFQDDKGIDLSLLKFVELEETKARYFECYLITCS